MRRKESLFPAVRFQVNYSRLHRGALYNEWLASHDLVLLAALSSGKHEGPTPVNPTLVGRELNAKPDTVAKSLRRLEESGLIEIESNDLARRDLNRSMLVHFLEPTDYEGRDKAWVATYLQEILDAVASTKLKAASRALRPWWCLIESAGACQQEDAPRGYLHGELVIRHSLANLGLEDVDDADSALQLLRRLGWVHRDSGVSDDRIEADLLREAIGDFRLRQCEQQAAFYKSSKAPRWA